MRAKKLTAELTWVVTQHCLNLGGHRKQVGCKPAVESEAIARDAGCLDDCVLLSSERRHLQAHLVANSHPCLDEDKPQQPCMQFAKGLCIYLIN